MFLQSLSLRKAGVILFFYSLAFSLHVSARPATFLQDFRVTWSDSHIRQIDGGRSIQLVLDQYSGCGFASKAKYLFGRVSMRIKLIPWRLCWDCHCLLYEFGHRCHYHLYTIFWNHQHIVFYVDDVPIRVYKNNEARGIPFPKLQPMGVYSTLWEADDWATRGGLEKINWSRAPFYAYYKDFDIEGCPVPGPATCASNRGNWWEGATYQALNALEARKYRWVRINHMIYDYCADKSRYPTTPPECAAGI
ncbi:hypothetical protein OIU84_030227 [Salix udensis]|uniref:Xyloglucan endotransglucosylase/hydrolase n=1 Tax=Salix udensis TaxID=889485 RepID=A0AAD6KBE4_9ROSI|nr:hypothetical protein OIU84_030227 [Salix udensis]